MAEQDRQDTQESQDQHEPVAGQDPRVGDTWEDMADHDTTGPQRRIGVLEIEGGQALVENKVTRRKSHVAVERFVPPYWRFIG